MRVVVERDASGQHIRLAEPDDFTRFHVEVRRTSGGPDALDRALRDAGLGRADGEGAAITIAGLTRLAPRGQDPHWRVQLDRMVDYARSRGWTDGAGTALLAHVEITE